ncbi:MAG: hypothetical protein EP343_12905 [Deltaproteobacteria bacterium]|nr:MAG: hypothetical protein EP343_12905 [Deltaproteobacteria bacterium]
MLVEPKPYFLRSDYIRGNSRNGTLMTRSNHRMIVLPEELIQGLHKAIEYQAGQALPIIMYTCGRKWGERLFRRWGQEWQQFHNKDWMQTSFAGFEVWLQEAFRYHGWGALSLDFSLENQGIVQYELKNSVLAKLLQDIETNHCCGIFSGLLAAITSGISGRELDAIEIECAHSGAPSCRFAVSIPEWIEKGRDVRRDGGSATEILQAIQAR